MNFKKMLYLLITLVGVLVVIGMSLDFKTHGFFEAFVQSPSLGSNLLVLAGVIVTLYGLHIATERLRFRYVYMLVGSLLTLGALFIVSPDQGFLSELSYGASFIATLVLMLRSVLYVAILHYSRKALFDYIDLEELYLKAKEDPKASAIAMLAVTVALIPIALLIVAAVGN